MKKLLSLTAVLALVVSLTGCGDSTKVTVCEGVNNGIDVKTELTYDGDDLISAVYENTLDVGDESYIDIVKTSVEDYKKQMEGVKGVEYSYTITGTVVTERTKITYKDADMAELVKLGIVEAEGDKTPTFVSYELTLENMKELGLTCTEQ